MDPISSFTKPSAPATTVRNPYQNFRRPTPAPQDGDEEVVEGAEAKPEVQLGDSCEASNALNRSSPTEEKKEDEDSTTRPPPPASGPTSSSSKTPNTGLAYWERLPSKNLSQESAEILTVSECVKHSTLYRGKAVRVTGQLHQRTFVGDDSQTPRRVLLELIDPIPMAIQQATPSHGSTPGKAWPPSKSTTPTCTIKTPYKTPCKTLGPARRPGSSGSSTLLVNSSTKTPSSSLLSAKRKRPWFATSARKKSPPKELPQTLLKVLVDPELPELDTIAPSGASKVMVLGVILESGGMQAQFVSLVDPSTDLSLYVKALQARRRYLYTRYKSMTPNSTTNGGDSGESSSVEVKDTAMDKPCLLLGCGPPPYDHFEQQAK